MRLSARSTLYVLATTLSLGLVACGGGDDGGDDDGPVEGDPHTYVVDSITIPVSATEAQQLGFDLDGDGTVDNQLGSILSALINAGGGDLDLQGSIDESVAQGEILLLANIQATALTSASNAGFFLYLGTNPSPAPCTDANDLVCGHHLDGSGSFDVDPAGPQDVRVRGNIVNGKFTGGPGDLALQIAFGDTAINLTLVEARAEINAISDGSFGSSKVGGAVPDEDIDNEVIPAVHTAVVEIIAEDCPTSNPGPETCGCMTDSTGLTLLGIFDENEDCNLPLDEVQNNSLIMTLLNPDVDTNGDGTPDALSVGVGATGISATFTVP